MASLVSPAKPTRDIVELLSAGNVSAVQSLLALGTDANHKDVGGIALLHRATAVNDVKMVKLLLLHGADVNITDELGNTSLHVACARGNVNVIEVLLQNNAKVALENSDGVTTIDLARDSGYFALARSIVSIVKTEFKVSLQIRRCLLIRSGNTTRGRGATCSFSRS